MTDVIRPYQAEHTLSDLEADISLQETIFRALKALRVENGVTIGVHDDINVVPVNSLELVDDTKGDAKSPTGGTLICKGKVIVEGEEMKVAAFRRGAGAGSGTTQASPGATAPSAAGGGGGAAQPAPGATPASGGADTTGPEGNPNLNPDGTPRGGGT